MVEHCLFYLFSLALIQTKYEFVTIPNYHVTSRFLINGVRYFFRESGESVECTGVFQRNWKLQRGRNDTLLSTTKTLSVKKSKNSFGPMT
jgi:hypothetical protein